MKKISKLWIFVILLTTVLVVAITCVIVFLCINFDKLFKPEKDVYEEIVYTEVIEGEEAYIKNNPTVAQVVTYSAETFKGSTTDDKSRPTYNYFPQGTVDMVVGKFKANGMEYLKLRCGRRVYTTKEDGRQQVLVTKTYSGELPSENKVSFSDIKVSNRFTEITLNTEWKAPFFLEYLPQGYVNPDKQDYKVYDFTASYIDISFCYSKRITGELSLNNNPVFSYYEIIENGSNCKLRLHLNKTGAFYGWNAEYNSEGQLVFSFLHPTKITSAQNKYGANLSGVTVFLEEGHGGEDPGSIGSDNLYEKVPNSYLANLIKNELQSIGAKVVLCRGVDKTMSHDQKSRYLISVKPDLCVSIHHDANKSSVPNGFGTFYSTPFSFKASKSVFEATIGANIYNPKAKDNRNRFMWHKYFLARNTVCPVVLTENGFISSKEDFEGIRSAEVNKQKAEAITQGIANYFLSIS